MIDPPKPAQRSAPVAAAPPGSRMLVEFGERDVNVHNYAPRPPKPARPPRVPMSRIEAIIIGIGMICMTQLAMLAYLDDRGYIWPELPVITDAMVANKILYACQDHEEGSAAFLWALRYKRERLAESNGIPYPVGPGKLIAQERWQNTVK